MFNVTFPSRSRSLLLESKPRGLRKRSNSKTSRYSLKVILESKHGSVSHLITTKRQQKPSTCSVFRLRVVSRCRAPIHPRNLSSVRYLIYFHSQSLTSQKQIPASSVFSFSLRLYLEEKCSRRLFDRSALIYVTKTTIVI